MAALADQFDIALVADRRLNPAADFSRSICGEPGLVDAVVSRFSPWSMTVSMGMWRQQAFKAANMIAVIMGDQKDSRSS